MQDGRAGGLRRRDRAWPVAARATKLGSVSKRQPSISIGTVWPLTEDFRIRPRRPFSPSPYTARRVLISALSIVVRGTVLIIIGPQTRPPWAKSIAREVMLRVDSVHSDGQNRFHRQRATKRFPRNCCPRLRGSSDNRMRRQRQSR